MRNVRRSAAGIAAIASAVLVMASFSWACTPQAMLSAIEPASAPAGSTVTVRGNHFDSAQVEIRWNAQDGRLLALASGPDVNTTVRLPDVAPGTYYIVAVGRSAADPSQIAGKATQPVTVTASTGSTNPPPTGGGAPSPTGQTATAPGAAPAPTSSPAASPAGTSAAPVGSPTASQPAPSSEAQPSVAPGTVEAPAATRATGTASAPATVAARATRPVAGQGPVGTATAATGERPATAPEAPATAGPATAVAGDADRVSGRTATGEAWSGFVDGASGPGLADRPSPAPASSPAAGRAGVLLFAGGLVALFAAATVALVRQRRLQKA